MSGLAPERASSLTFGQAQLEIPPRVEYRLTPLGEGLRAVLDTMAAWAVTVPDGEPTAIA
ncbi:winged helix-turn-helix transcriptional regulator [Streptomyces sp. NPDC002787]